MIHEVPLLCLTQIKLDLSHNCLEECMDAHSSSENQYTEAREELQTQALRILPFFMVMRGGIQALSMPLKLPQIQLIERCCRPHL
jgi:hypothetical protein